MKAFLESAFSVSGLVLNSAYVNPLAVSSPGSPVVVTGFVSVFDVESVPASLEMRHVQGRLVSEVKVRPDVGRVGAWIERIAGKQPGSLYLKYDNTAIVVTTDKEGALGAEGVGVSGYLPAASNKVISAVARLLELPGKPAVAPEMWRSLRGKKFVREQMVRDGVVSNNNNGTAPSMGNLPIAGLLQPKWDVNGSCPDGLRLAPHVLMTDCVVVIDGEKQYSFAVKGKATAALPGHQAALEFQLSGASAYDSLTLTGEDGGVWKVLDRDDLAVEDARLDYTSVDVTESALITGHVTVDGKIPCTISSNLQRDGAGLFTAMIVPQVPSIARLADALSDAGPQALALAAVDAVYFSVSSRDDSAQHLVLPSGAVRVVPVSQGLTLSGTITMTPGAIPEVDTVASLSPAPVVNVTFAAALRPAGKGFLLKVAMPATLTLDPTVSVSAAYLLVDYTSSSSSALSFAVSGTATVVVAPASADQAVRQVSVKASAAVQGRVLDLAGSLAAPWQVSPSFALSDASVALRVDLDAKTAAGRLMGSLSSGDLKLNLLLALDSLAHASRSQVALVAALDGKFALTQLAGFEDLSPELLPGLDVSSAMFVLSSYTGQVDVSALPGAPQPALDVAAGLNGFALLKPRTSTGAAASLAGMGAPESVLLRVSYDPKTRAASVSCTAGALALTGGVTLGSSTLTISSAAPYVTLAGDVQVTPPAADASPLVAALRGDWRAEGSWNLEGTAPGPWTIKLGGLASTTATFSSLYVRAVLGPAVSSPSVKFGGAAVVAGIAVEAYADLPLTAYAFKADCPAAAIPVAPAVNVTSCEFRLQSTAPLLAVSVGVSVLASATSKPITATLAGSFTPPSALTLEGTASNWSPIQGVTASTATVSFANQPALHVGVAAQIAVNRATFGVALDLSQGPLASLTVAGTATQVSWGDLVNSDDASGIVATSVLAVVTDRAQNYTGPNAPTSFSVLPGVNLRALLTFSKTGSGAEIKTLAALLGDGTALSVEGRVNPTGGAWSFSTSLLGTVTVSPAVTLTAASLTLASAQPFLTLAGALTVSLDATHPVVLAASAAVSGPSVDFAGSMQGTLKVLGFYLSDVQGTMHFDGPSGTASGAIQGTFQVGSGLQLTAALQVPSSLGPNGYSFVAFPPSPFDLASLPGLGSVPAGLKVSKAMFVISTYAGTLDLSGVQGSPTPSMAVGEGLNFAAELELGASASAVPELATLQGFLAQQGSTLPTVVVSAVVSLKQGDTYTLKASINNLALPLGSSSSSSLSLTDATFTLSSSGGNSSSSSSTAFGFVASASVTVPHQSDPLAFTVTCSLTGSTWSASAASVGVWTIPVGSTSFTAKDLSLEISPTVQRIRGDLDIGGFVVDIDATFPLTDSTKVSLSGTCPPAFQLSKSVVLQDCSIVLTDKQTSLQALAVLTLGTETLGFSASGTFAKDYLSVAGDLTATWQPQGSTLVAVSSGRAAFNYTRVADKVTVAAFSGELTSLENSVDFGFAVDISGDLSGGYVLLAFAANPEAFALSQVPRVASADPVASKLTVGNAALIWTPVDVPAWSSPALPGVPSFTLDLKAGLTFRGDLTIGPQSPVPEIAALSALPEQPASAPTVYQLAGHISPTGAFELDVAVSDLVLSSQVTLKRASLHLAVAAEGALSLAFAAQGTVTLDPAHAFTADIQASLKGKVFDFVGSLEGSLEVGGVTLKAAQLALHLDATNPAQRVFSGAVQGELAITDSLTVLARLQVPSPLGDAQRGYVLVAYPEAAFALNSLPGMSSLPAGIVISKAIFAVSPFAGTLDLSALPSPPAASVPVGVGVNFACIVDLSGSQLAPELGTLRSLLSTGGQTAPSELTVAAVISRSSYSLVAQVSNIALGQGAVILEQATFRIQSYAPNLALSASTSINVPKSTTDLAFQLNGTLSGSQWSFTGATTDTWVIPVADTEMVLRELNIALRSDASKEAGYSGSFHGSLSFADFVVDVDMAFPLSEAGGKMDLQGHCPPDFHLGKRVTLSQCAIYISTETEPHYRLSADATLELPDNDPVSAHVEGTFGSSEVRVSGALTSAWKPFRSGELLVSAASIGYSKVGSGDQRVDSGYVAGALAFKGTTQLAFNATIAVPAGGDASQYAFAAFPSGSASMPFGSVALTGAAVVLCNYEGSFTIPSNGAVIAVKPHINVFAEFVLSTLPEYETLRGVAVDPSSIPATIKITGWMQDSTPQDPNAKYSLSAKISDLRLGKSVTLQNCVIGIYSDEPKFRLEDVAVQVALPKQTVLFSGSAVVSGQTFTVDAQMATTWQVGKRALQGAKVHLSRDAQGAISGLIEADLRVGSADKPVDLIAKLQFPWPGEDGSADSSDGFAFWAYPKEQFSIRLLPGLPASFPDLYLTDLFFVLATAPGTVDLGRAMKAAPAAQSNFHFRDGLTFVAVINLKDQPELAPVKGWLATASDTLGSLVVSANLDDDHYSFLVELENLVLSSKVVLKEAKLIIQTVSPWFALQATTQVAVGADSAPLSFQLSGHLGADSWAIAAASTEPWKINFGSKVLVIDNVALSLYNPPGKTGPSWMGSLSGELLFGTTSVTVNVDFPVPDAGLVISGVIQQTDLAGALAPLEGGQAVDGASSGNPIYAKMKAAKFVNAQFRLQTSPVSLQVTGLMTVFGDVPLRAGAAVLRTPTGDWAGAFGLGLGDDFQFSKVESALAVLDDVKLPKACFVISSAELPAYDIFLDGSKKDLRAGFEFEAELPMRGRGLEMIKKWTGIETAVVRAEFLTSARQFTLRAGVQGHIKITDDLTLTDAGLFFKVNPGEVQVGLDCKLAAKLSDKPQDLLRFYGAVYVSPDGAGFDAAMTTPWVEPFGAKGVTVLQSAITIKFSWAAGMPTKLGLAGGLQIGKSSGELVVLVNVVVLTNSMFMGRLANINLLEIVEKCTHHVVESGFARTALNVGFQELMVYVNMASQALEFNGHIYQPGFKASAQEINLFGVLRGSASVEVWTDKGVEVKAHCMPFSIGNLLSVSGAQGPASNATFELTLVKGKTPRFLVSGAVTVLNAVGLSVLLDFNDQYLLADVRFVSELFDFQLMLQSVGEFPRVEDFIVSGIVNSRVLDYIAEKVPELMRRWMDDTNGDLKAAQAKVAEKQAALDDKRAKRDAIKAEVLAKLGPAIEALAGAQEDLARAKSKVQRLDDKIRELEQERSEAKGIWNAPKRAWLSVEIAATWVLQKVAMAALDVASALVKVAQRAVEGIVPNLDPRVIALNIEIGVLEAAYGVAQLLLKTCERLVTAFADVVSWLAKGAAQFINIRSASVSGSLKALKAGNLGSMSLNAVIMGKTINFSVSLDFSRIDRIVESVFGVVSKGVAAG